MKIGIIGGGPSGLICAIRILKSAPFDVTIIEKGDRIGKKILASGNGRCNLSNVDFDEFKFNDRRVREAFSVTNQDEMLREIKDLPLSLTTEDGRIYPSTKQASTVLDALRNKCRHLGAKEKVNSKVIRIEKGEKYTLTYDSNEKEEFDYLVLAIGSDILVKDYNGFSLFNDLGLKTREFKPSIVPIECDSYILKGLNGIRSNCALSYGEHKEEGEILFRNYGISGIPSLIMSSYIARGKKGELILDLLPNNEKEIKEQLLASSLTPIESLSGIVNKIIAKNVLEKVNGLNEQVFTDELVEKVIKELKNIRLDNIKTLGKQEAQVGVGGIDLNEVDLSTMKAKNHKNLYLVGEELDIDGICGGYNLSFAFISGINAAKDIVKQWYLLTI